MKGLQIYCGGNAVIVRSAVEKEIGQERNMRQFLGDWLCASLLALTHVECLTCRQGSVQH